MKELLHHFGIIDNRVRIGMSTQLADDEVHGVALGISHGPHGRLRVPFMVDRPAKLNSLNDAMVIDMVDQIDKLGMQVEVIELHSTKSIYTYRPTDAGQVELVSKSPRYSYRTSAA